MLTVINATQTASTTTKPPKISIIIFHSSINRQHVLNSGNRQLTSLLGRLAAGSLEVDAPANPRIDSISLTGVSILWGMLRQRIRVLDIPIVGA